MCCLSDWIFQGPMVKQITPVLKRKEMLWWNDSWWYAVILIQQGLICLYSEKILPATDGYICTERVAKTILKTHSSKGDVSIKSLSSEHREPCERGEKKSVRTSRVGGHLENEALYIKRTWFQGLYKILETDATSTRPPLGCTRSFVNILKLSV